VVSVHPTATRLTSLGPAADFVGGGDDGVVDALGPDAGDVVDRLRAAFPDVARRNFPDTDRQILSGGFVGFLAYEAVYDLWLDEVGVERPETTFPDAEFLLDALAAEADRVAAALADADAPDPDGIRVRAEEAGAQSAYEDAVETAKRHVLDGDIYQGVISRSRRLRGDVDPLGLYAALRDVNPSPYMYVLRHDDRTVVGASPETLVSVKDDRVVSNPIAGTCPRGTSPVEDRRLAGEMLADGKERAEHTMLVDLARNDVRRVSTPGSVIESTVTGRLAAEADPFDATRAAFPAGTLTGAPKVRAMEIIDALEPTPREAYGGGVGYFSWTGDADFAIVIRTATLRSDVGERGADEVTIRAGAGLVADSDPTAEYEETEHKMEGVLAAVDRIREEMPADAPAPTEGVER
jgi:anthranilate synthase component 1